MDALAKSPAMRGFLLFVLWNKSIRQVNHFPDSIIRKVTTFEFIQHIRKLVFHFHHEVFFKLLYLAHFYFTQQTLCTEVYNGHLLFYWHRCILWLFQDLHVTGTFIKNYPCCSIQVTTKFREGFHLAVKSLVEFQCTSYFLH